MIDCIVLVKVLLPPKELQGKLDAEAGDKTKVLDQVIIIINNIIIIIIIQGADWVDPDDPMLIAENELLGAAESIERAARKLATLKPRKEIKGKVGKKLKYII